jgi:hypothetical protein
MPVVDFLIARKRHHLDSLIIIHSTNERGAQEMFDKLVLHGFRTFIQPCPV